MKIFDSSFDGKVVSLNKKFAWTIMLLSGLLMLAGWQWERITSIADGMWTGPAKPRIGGTTEDVKEPLVIKAKISPDEWTDWVSLPNVFQSFHLQTAGWVEFQFLNGMRKRFAAGEKFNWKNVPDGTFKLRGEGCEATVVVRF